MASLQPAEASGGFFAHSQPPFGFSSILPTSLGVNPQLTTMTMATAIGRDLLRA